MMLRDRKNSNGEACKLPCCASMFQAHRSIGRGAPAGSRTPALASARCPGTCLSLRHTSGLDAVPSALHLRPANLVIPLIPILSALQGLGLVGLVVLVVRGKCAGPV